MSHEEFQRRLGLRHNIHSLWKYWALSVGSLVFPAVLSPITPEKYMPLICIAILTVLMAMDRHNRRKQSPDCFRQPFVIIVSLTIAAFAIGLSIIYDPDVFRSPYPGADTPNPFLFILVLGPASLVVSLYYMIRGKNPAYCKACVARNGNAIDRGFIGKLIHEEIVYQGKFFFAISLATTAVTWIYYCIFYVEINVNPSDQFYFVAFPVAIYIFSLVYLAFRYHSLWNFYSTDPEMKKLIARKGTTLRFLLFCDDNILLASREVELNDVNPLVDDLRIDTPAIFSINHSEKISDDEALAIFKRNIKCENPQMYYLYESHDYAMRNNLIHYCIFFDKESDVLVSDTKAEWFTVNEIVKLINDQMVTRTFQLEFKRICTIAMTSKTYDRDGNRLHPVKHYRPTFRLRDFAQSKVDFNDDRWLAVSMVNADKPFFKVRKLWKRIVKGLDI